MFHMKGFYFSILLLVLLHVVKPTIIRRSNGNAVEVKVARAGKALDTSSETDTASSEDNKDDDATSLDLKDSATSSASSRDGHPKPGHPPIDPSRPGWRRWHRKCTPCPADQALKWRDPRISWICGAYQRARRSFKSECSMRLRNCQDGTMFTKISDFKCKSDSTKTGENGTTLFPRHGRHFFYEYRVDLSGDRSSLYKDDSDTSNSDTKSSVENLYE